MFQRILEVPCASAAYEATVCIDVSRIRSEAVFLYIVQRNCVRIIVACDVSHTLGDKEHCGFVSYSCIN